MVFVQGHTATGEGWGRGGTKIFYACVPSQGFRQHCSCYCDREIETHALEEFPPPPRRIWETFRLPNTTHRLSQNAASSCPIIREWLQDFMHFKYTHFKDVYLCTASHDQNEMWVIFHRRHCCSGNEVFLPKTGRYGQELMALNRIAISQKWRYH